MSVCPRVSMSIHASSTYKIDKDYTDKDGVTCSGIRYRCSAGGQRGLGGDHGTQRDLSKADTREWHVYLYVYVCMYVYDCENC